VRRSVLLVLAAVAFAVPATATAASPMYWGGTISGEPYGLPEEAPENPAVLQRFEKDAGKEVTFVNLGQGWATFKAGPMNNLIAAGALPLVTMWLGEGLTLEDVAKGKQDAQIRAWAQAAKEFGYPFLFRPWWEMNGAWYSWGRSDWFIPAWQHFHKVVEEVGATNVTWAWIVNTIYEPSINPAPWYPGDAYVDWIGMDAYNWGYNPAQPDRWVTAEESIQPTLEAIEEIAPTKPVCICESASTEHGHGADHETKSVWIHEMLDEYLPSQPQIKAYLYFNWNVENGTNHIRYDWPIESSPEAEKAFREGIASPTYLSQLPPLRKLHKVPIPGAPPEEEPDPTEPLPTAPTPAGGGGGASTGPPVPPGGPPLARREASAENRLIIGTPRLNPATGTARVPVLVPGRGTLRISGKGIGVRVLPAEEAVDLPADRWVPKRERLVLRVSTAGAKRRTLESHGQVSAGLELRFSPVGGKARTWHTPITLRRPGR
jgi:hypothetical protein